MFKVAVIGLGKLGFLHTRIYANLPNVQISGICDIDPKAVKSTKQKLNLNSLYTCLDYKQILKTVPQAVSIATPTYCHFEIAKFFLSKKIPCLVEKPLSPGIKQAKALLNLAKKNNTLLMIGHVERFNPALISIKKFIKQPKFIECDRLSPYPNRSTDISVVLDLMIHDLDIILNLVNSPVKKTEAVGVNVLSASPDIANVRIKFANGCIANISASRISQTKLRKIRVFQPDSYISLDYAQQKAEIFKKRKKTITNKQIPIFRQQPLEKEILNFVNSIRQRKIDFTAAQDIIKALSLSLHIEKLINSRK